MATREEFIQALQDLADYLTANPDVPVPKYSSEISVIPDGDSDETKRAAVDAIAAQLGVEARMHGAAYLCELRFGPIQYRAFTHTAQHMADWDATLRIGKAALEARNAAQAEQQPAAVEAEPETVAA